MRSLHYYQHDPTTAPYACSWVAGFTQHLDAGSQVASFSHTQVVRPNLSITETFLNIGAGGLSMGALTSVFHNRFNPSAHATWTHSRHTLTFGGSFEYTQLNTRDRRNELGMIDAQDISQFSQGVLNNDYLYGGTLFLSGNANCYWRANETCEYIQDNFGCAPNLSVCGLCEEQLLQPSALDICAFDSSSTVT